MLVPSEVGAGCEASCLVLPGAGTEPCSDSDRSSLGSFFLRAIGISIFTLIYKPDTCLIYDYIEPVCLKDVSAMNDFLFL